MGLEPYTLEIKSDEFHSIFRLIPEKIMEIGAEGEKIPFWMLSQGVDYYSNKKGKLEQKTLRGDSKIWGKQGKFKEEYLNHQEYSEHNIYLSLDKTKIKLNEIYFDDGSGESRGIMITKKGFLRWNKTLLNNLSIE